MDGPRGVLDLTRQGLEPICRSSSSCMAIFDINDEDSVQARRDKVAAKISVARSETWRDRAPLFARFA